MQCQQLCRRAPIPVIAPCALHATQHAPWLVAPNAGAMHQPGLLCKLHMDTHAYSARQRPVSPPPAPPPSSATGSIYMRNTYTAQLLKQACQLHHAHAPDPPRQRAAALHSSRAPGPWQGASSAAPMASHTHAARTSMRVLAMGPRAWWLPAGRRHWRGVQQTTSHWWLLRASKQLTAEHLEARTAGSSGTRGCRLGVRRAKASATAGCLAGTSRKCHIKIKLWW